MVEGGTCDTCKSPTAPLGEVLEVDPGTLQTIVAEVKVPIMIEFWAPWSEDCKAYPKLLAALAAKLAGKALVFTLDAEKYPDLALRFGVQRLPSVAVMKRGTLVFVQYGVYQGAQLEAMLKQSMLTSAGG